jgi:hypothetical protein
MAPDESRLLPPATATLPVPPPRPPRLATGRTCTSRHWWGQRSSLPGAATTRHDLMQRTSGRRVLRRSLSTTSSTPDRLDIRADAATSYWQDSVVAGVTGAARLGIDAVGSTSFIGPGRPPPLGTARSRRGRVAGGGIAPSSALPARGPGDPPGPPSPGRSGERAARPAGRLRVKTTRPTAGCWPLLGDGASGSRLQLLFAAVDYEPRPPCRAGHRSRQLQLGEQLHLACPGAVPVLGGCPAGIALSGGDLALLEMFCRVAMR